MRSAIPRTLFLMALAAAFASCASIPSLNEPPLYSSYVKTSKGVAGERTTEVFVLYSARGYASDDSYVVSVERKVDASGANEYALALQYTGNVAESIDRLMLKVDDSDVDLGVVETVRGYSGRFRSERVVAHMGAAAVAALKVGKKVVIRYYGAYATRPIEIPQPGLEALRDFLGK